MITDLDLPFAHSTVGDCLGVLAASRFGGVHECKIQLHVARDLQLLCGKAGGQLFGGHVVAWIGRSEDTEA